MATWYERINEFRLSAAADTATTTLSLRHRLAQIYQLIASAPDAILQFYDSFDESELAKLSKQRLHRLAQGDFSLIGKALARDQLFDLSVLLRALDEKLAEAEEGPVPKPSAAWSCPEVGVYVVPIAHFLDQRSGPRTRQSFGRRGLLRHRVIPMEVRNIRIEIERHPDVLSSGLEVPRRLSTFGAGLFQGFDVGLSYPKDDEFVVTSVSCDGGVQETVAAHLARATAEGCEVVMWPELTIDPAAQQHIAGLLGRGALDESPLTVVVAGSWHREYGPDIYNESTVLSGRGEPLIVVRKIRRFEFNGRFEGITPGDRITLLALENELLAFAICKDFCDKAREVPIKSLDIDVALIPSMGGETTILAHIDAADDLRVLFGTASFIVQQSYPAEPPQVGHVMKLPGRPNLLQPKDLEVRTDWQTLQREELKYEPEPTSE